MNAIQNYVWGLSKKQQHEETIIEITTTQPNQTFEWYSVTGPVQYYDWNGTRTNSKAHTFASAGVYTIKIVGDITHFRMNSLNFLVTKIIQVASTINNFSWSFYGCKNLTSIPAGLFDKNINATNFLGCFTSCSSLTSIPSSLFDKNINVTNFQVCFSYCTGLTSIPSGLFEKNINATNFSYCFAYCSKLASLSSTLFEKNINATNFSGCFSSCTSLINRPKPHGLEMWEIAGTNGRPSNINIQSMFKNCTAMPDHSSLHSSVKY